MGQIGAARMVIVAAMTAAASIVGVKAVYAESPKDFLKIAISAQPNTLDITATRKTSSVKPAIENVVETLWDIDRNGNLIPGLASWTLSKDGKTITFHLRHGVKFHTGDEMTADDVIFSHERRKKRTPIYRIRLKTLKKVEKIDKYTVRFEFTEPALGFLSARGLYIVSKAYYDRVGEKTFTQHPVGTGPYKFVTYSPGQYIDVERFDGYWGKLPQVKRARFLITKEPTTRVAQLRAGEVDMIMNTPWPQVSALRSEVRVHESACALGGRQGPRSYRARYRWRCHRTRATARHSQALCRVGADRAWLRPNSQAVQIRSRSIQKAAGESWLS